MNRIALKIVNRLIRLELIVKADKDIYLYQVEMFIIKITGILLISIVGILTNKYIETFVFYITFSVLRTYTNGYHSKSFKICLIQSVISYLLICEIISVIFIENLLLSHLITLFSMIVIYALSPVNSENIMLSKDELLEHKEVIKYILIIYLVIIAMFINFKITHNVVAFFEIAILFDMILVVVGKIVYKDWR